VDVSSPRQKTNVKLIRSLDQLPHELRGGAVSIGNFDGVHRGHAELVGRLAARAAKLGGAAVVFTFDPHPAAVLPARRAALPLCWTERKADLLGRLGVDALIAYPTDEALLGLAPRVFFDRIVRERLDARAVVEGPNFFFGRGRRGNVDLLRRYCAGAGLELEVVEPVQVEGEMVSSSRIRGLLLAGRIDAAGKMLTEPYRIRGLVAHGAGRGAGLGFPTANLEGVDTLLPGSGIYAGRAWIDRRAWPAAISLGPNPTFAEAALKVEVHLIDFEGSLYGQTLEVDFLARLRDIIRFDCVDRLLAQMKVDVAAAGRIAAGV